MLALALALALALVLAPAEVLALELKLTRELALELVLVRHMYHHLPPEQELEHRRQVPASVQEIPLGLLLGCQQLKVAQHMRVKRS